MNDNKHICSLTWCDEHKECFYKSPSTDLKNSVLVQLNEREKICCYHQDWVNNLHSREVPCKPEAVVKKGATIIKLEVKPKEVESYSTYDDKVFRKKYCENPKCYSLADLHFNSIIHLCNHCKDELLKCKTHHEIARHFNDKIKLQKFFIQIYELTNENEVIRCVNIYCGTTERITQHHLIPKPFRDGGKIGKIPLCRTCHDRVHELKTITQLKDHYYTKEAVVQLLANDVEFRVERMMSVGSNEVAMVA